MEIVFAQSNQECGSTSVSLYAGNEKLAEVGIGETRKVHLEDKPQALRVGCGMFVVPISLDSSCTIEVSWNLIRASMMVYIDKKLAGEKSII